MDDPASLEPTLESARQWHRAGRVAEAEAIYRSILKERPDCAEAWLQMGIIAGQVGQMETAIELLERAALLAPNLVQAHGMLGEALQAMGRLDEAITAYRRAVALDPGLASARNNLANSLMGQERVEEAIVEYREALRLLPELAAVHANLGNALKKAGHLAEAIAACLRALELEPASADAYNNLGIALQADGRLEEALAAMREAARLAPRAAIVRFNLGTILEEAGELDRAREAYEAALELDPHRAEAYRNLGNILQRHARHDEAIAAYNAAIRIDGRDADAYANMSNALLAQGKPGEAAAAARTALRIRPDSPRGHNALAITLAAGKQIEAAVDEYREALRLDPGFTIAMSNLGSCYRELARLKEATEQYRKAIAHEPRNAVVQSNLLYALCFHPEYSAAELLAELIKWDECHAKPLAPRILPHHNDPSPERRLRLGYVSPDFRGHVVGRNILPLLREADHEQFEIFCYANLLRPDAFTAELKALAHHWRDIAGLTDDETAAAIRADGIDVLVDLSLHMAGNRLPVFARKPAPVQVTFAGYPGSTGLAAMDWRLTDPYLDPPGVTDGEHRERSWRLPHSFWCYDPAAMTFGLDKEPEVAPLPALRNGHVTFGCLNNFGKINEPTLRLWAGAMRAAPDSHLLLLTPADRSRTWVTDLLQQEGIAPERVEFTVGVVYEEYLRLYDRIDLGLDPLPYNGHTTSLDSFWMGAPVVTLVGRTVAGRAGFSQLSNLGLTELAARDAEEFVEIAAGLANDLDRLAALRQGLRERMRQSPLTDAIGFTRGIEAAYREMWREWANGRTPTVRSSESE